MPHAKTFLCFLENVNPLMFFPRAVCTRVIVQQTHSAFFYTDHVLILDPMGQVTIDNRPCDSQEEERYLD